MATRGAIGFAPTPRRSTISSPAWTRRSRSWKQSNPECAATHRAMAPAEGVGRHGQPARSSSTTRTRSTPPSFWRSVRCRCSAARPTVLDPRAGRGEKEPGEGVDRLLQPGDRRGEGHRGGDRRRAPSDAAQPRQLSACSIAEDATRRRARARCSRKPRRRSTRWPRTPAPSTPTRRAPGWPASRGAKATRRHQGVLLRISSRTRAPSRTTHSCRRRYVAARANQSKDAIKLFEAARTR